MSRVECYLRRGTEYALYRLERLSALLSTALRKFEDWCYSKALEVQP